MHDSHFGCGISNLPVSHRSARVIYREHTFTPGQFIYWNTSDKDYNLAFEGNCSFLVVAVDECGTWFEVACTGEYEIDNFDITGEAYLDAQGALTATPTKTKVGFIENGNIFLSIQPISEAGVAQVNADWNALSGLAKILNKPILFSGDYNDLSNLPTLFSGKYSDLVGKPSLFSGSYYDLTNLPMLFSGSYNDLTDAPIIPDAQVNADWNATSGAAQILNKPNISTFNPADVDYLTFDTTPETTSSAIGTVSWNNTDMTLDVVQTNGTVLQVGQEFQIRVVNKSGVAIPNGHVVYLTGAQGNRITASLARSDEFATSQAIAIATEDIAVNAEGFVTKLGLVRGINTATFTEGSAVYLSSTIAGDIVQSAPASPNRIVRIGYVVRSHATVGSIFVTIDSTPTFDDISDISVSTVTNGQSIAYDSATKTWIPYTPSAGGGSNAPIIAGTGNYSIVANYPLSASRNLGRSASVFGEDTSASASAYTSIVFGNISNAGSSFSLVGGFSSSVLGSSMAAVSIGWSVTNKDSRYSQSFGENVSISDSWASLAFGSHTTVTDSLYSVVGGYGNTVASSQGIAVFGQSHVTVTNSQKSLLAGYSNSLTKGEYSLVCGQNNVLKNGTFCVIGGQSNTITTEGQINTSIALGYNVKIYSSFSFAGGASNTLSSNYQTAFGQSNVLNGVGHTAFGNGNTLNGGNWGFVSGVSNTVNGTNGQYPNTCFSSYSTITGSGNFLGNGGNLVTGDNNSIIGIGNTVNGSCNNVEGNNNTGNASYCHVEGVGNIAGLNNQHIEGKYALDDSLYTGGNQKVHKVGWGTDSVRKDIHFIRADGTIGTAAFKTDGTGTPTGLGAKCPAVTPTVPYAWLQFELSDGSTVYIPAWK